MLTIPTIPGQDTIGIFGGGFNSPSAGSAVGAYYLLVNPENTLYLVSPFDSRVYPTISILTYLRSDGTSSIFRSDGTSRFIQP